MNGTTPSSVARRALDAERTVLDAADRVLAPTYVRPDRLFVRGFGCWLEDASGRRFLDATSGVAVNALGHASPFVVEAARAALTDGLIHTSNLFHTAPAVALAGALVERCFADRVFFANSGAEAVEGAIKFARLASGAGANEIIYFDGSFHGRTFGALSATDRPAQRTPFAPLVPGFIRARWEDEADLSKIGPGTAAVIVEPVQGEGGIRVADAAWLRAIRRRCDETETLLIVDEIQTGLGRTGRLWAHQRSGIRPDLMAVAKPLAGGLPMGAVLMTERVASAITPGSHATTFGGGPFVARVALAVVNRVSEPTFLDEVARKGHLLRGMLEALEEGPLVSGTRSDGLLAGIQVPGRAPALVAAAFEEELLVVAAADDVVRVIPPLDIADDDLIEMVRRLERALGRVAVVAEGRP